MISAKTYISADDLLTDSFRLADLIHRSGLRPSHIVGIWRGGAPIGIAVQELLEYRGIHADHIAIRTSSYSGIDQQEPQVKVYALGYLIDTLNPDDTLLVVDDVFDSGRSGGATATRYGLPLRGTNACVPRLWRSKPASVIGRGRGIARYMWIAVRPPF